MINAATLLTTIYWQPPGDRYAYAREIPSDMLLVPTLVPDLAVRLNTLSLE